jgi:hypothetical protein
MRKKVTINPDKCFEAIKRFFPEYRGHQYFPTINDAVFYFEVQKKPHMWDNYYHLLYKYFGMDYLDSVTLCCDVNHYVEKLQSKQRIDSEMAHMNKKREFWRLALKVSTTTQTSSKCLITPDLVQASTTATKLKLF